MSNKYPGSIITSGANAGYSVAFDGTGDFLSLATNAAFNFGSGAFTVECWFYPNTISGTQCLVTNYGSSTTGFVIQMGGSVSGSGKIDVNLSGDGADITGVAVLTANTWNHIAVSGTPGASGIRLFVNGVQTGSTYTGSTTLDTSSSLLIGSVASTNYVNGYISNVRIVKGTALYTAAFTPPTQLFAITNTSLLTCNSPAIVDQSSNAFTITANGNAAVSTFTPFTGYTAYNPALGAATPGIWTVSDAIQAAQTRRWNMYDPYFNYTTLLLHGNGTNGAQNNTFLDSSSNNFTITRNGNTTQGTFSPFSQTGWSNYFGGTSYLNNTSAALITQTVSTFTVEGWVYLTAAPASISDVSGFIALDGTATTSTNYLSFGPDVNRVLKLRWFDGAGKVCSGSTTLNLNQWYHIAVVANSNAITMYVNGVAETVSGTTTLTNRNGTTGNFSVAYNNNGSAAITGYISNIRVTTTAVYTGAFTPSTSALSAITGTVFLSCQDNRFKDNSTNNYALSVGGTPSVQAFSPFYPLVAYTPQAQGGGGYFDGTGDYLATGLATALDNISGDFTIEYWQYPIAGQPALSPVLGSANGSFSGTASFVAYEESSNKLNLYLNATQATSLISYAATTKLINQWSHVAWVRSGSVITLYLNGTSVATVTYTNTISLNTTNSNTYIGRNGWDAYYWYGYISGLRIVKGTAIVPSGAPTTPPTAVTNTQLLLNYTNAGITDATAKNDLETVGNAQISTTQSKFGGSSLYFDGTGDWLVWNPASVKTLDFGTGDFTIECWIYLNSSATAAILSPDGTNRFTCTVNYVSGQLSFYDNSTTTVYSTSGASITTGSWTHIAWVRSSGTLAMYVNGTSYYSASRTTNFGPMTTARIGADIAGASVLNGYIDDLRISKFARYTGNFTPQTSQWQDQ